MEHITHLKNLLELTERRNLEIGTGSLDRSVKHIKDQIAQLETGTHEYALDVSMRCVVRVTAGSEAEAREKALELQQYELDATVAPGLTAMKITEISAWDTFEVFEIDGEPQ